MPAVSGRVPAAVLRGTERHGHAAVSPRRHCANAHDKTTDTPCRHQLPSLVCAHDSSSSRSSSSSHSSSSSSTNGCCGSSSKVPAHASVHVQHCSGVLVYSIETLRQLSRSLFSSRYSQPVSNFLLPAIARDARFPFVHLLHSLLPSEMIAGIGSVNELSCDWCLAIEPTIWLLHSTLNLATPHLGIAADVFS